MGAHPQARQGRQIVAHGDSRGRKRRSQLCFQPRQGRHNRDRRSGIVLSPLPGLALPLASSSHGYRHGPHSIAAPRLSSNRGQGEIFRQAKERMNVVARAASHCSAGVSGFWSLRCGESDGLHRSPGIGPMGSTGVPKSDRTGDPPSAMGTSPLQRLVPLLVQEGARRWSSADPALAGSALQSFVELTFRSAHAELKFSATRPALSPRGRPDKAQGNAP
jgi:hypothetical protein